MGYAPARRFSHDRLAATTNTQRNPQGRTMIVTVDEQDKLKRKISIEVPSSEVQSAYEEVYAQINSNLRINGFRPGKFPKHLAEKRFQSLMSGEAMQHLVPKYFEQALKELDVRPATEPKFDNLEIEKKKPFKFQVEFEIVPTVKLLALNAFKLTEKKIKVGPQDVEERIEELRLTRGAFEDKGDQPAQKDDWVTFDFQGTRDGEPFEGGSGENQRIEVGSPQFLPDFDKQFDGIKAGESKTFDLTFPEDYGEASLAGQPVQFQITANTVEKKVPAALDKDFFSQFGASEDLESFQEHMQSQLTAEREREAMQEHQTALTDQIRDKYDFDVPESLVEQSLENFEHQLSHDDPEALEDQKKLAKLKKEEEKKIRGNIRATYVIGAYARENDIQVDQEEVKQRFFMQAYMMRQNPQELLEDSLGKRMLTEIEQNLSTAKTLGHMAEAVLAGKQSGANAGKDKKGKEAGEGKGKAASAK